MLIFSILDHPRSFLIYCYFFGVFLSYQTKILWFPSHGRLLCTSLGNYSKYRDVAPLRIKQSSKRSIYIENCLLLRDINCTVIQIIFAIITLAFYHIVIGTFRQDACCACSSLVLLVSRQSRSQRSRSALIPCGRKGLRGPYNLFV